MKNEIYVSFKMFQFHVDENAKLYDDKHIERITFYKKLYDNKKIRVLRIDDNIDDIDIMHADINDILEFVYEMNEILTNDFVFSMYNNHDTKLYFVNIDVENEYCDIESEIYENDAIDQLIECLSFFNVKHEINKIDNENSNCTFTSTKRNLINFMKHNFGTIDLINDVDMFEMDTI